MTRLAWVVLVGSICLQLCSTAQGQAFLQQQLPLNVLVATPSDMIAQTGGDDGSEKQQTTAVTLQGRQALTVVFSRPVIALGSDWGSKQLQEDLVPFRLSCGTPGRLRWVTTNIARFDPSVEWPADLDCSFDWNRGLKSYDGAPLQLGDLQPSVRLQTQPLTMNVQQVQSEAATAATGGQWDAFLGSPDDQLPEVPPDANMTLSFSYPVELAQLAKSLKVAGPGAGSRTVTVSPCVTPAAIAITPLLVFTANGIQQQASSGGGGGNAVSPADLLKPNSTCAVVRIVPGLEPGAAAVLRLPKGARYSSLAGPVAQDTDVNVYGLRPFRIPLRWDFMNITSAQEQVYNGATYRRLTMWLPHGLSRGTSLSDVSSAVKLCCLSDPFGNAEEDDGSAACVDQPYELSRPAPAVLSLRVPALNPRQRCRVTVRADGKVKDAFDLPLQASRNVWWTNDLDAAYTGPSVRQVALLEPAAGGSTLNWPWVSRGTPEEGIRQVAAVNIPVDGSVDGTASSSSSLLARAISGVLAGYSGAAASLLGSTGIKAVRKEATWPTFQSLALPGQPGISLVGTCCRQVTWPTQREVLGTTALVVQSDLQAAFVEQGGRVIAWVTTTQGESRPVEGAKVQVYNSMYGKDAAIAGPACVTASDGSCIIDLAAAAKAKKQQQQQQQAKAASGGSNSGSSGNSAFQPTEEVGSYSAVITAKGHGPLVVPDVPNSARYSSSSGASKEYVATLVLDRKLVKPGDDLHVTAYIQRKEGSQLRVAADLTSVVLQVSPGFDSRAAGTGSSSSSSRGPPLRITAKLDPAYGTAHAVIPVPRNATPANYNLQLFTPGAGASNAAAAVSNAAATVGDATTTATSSRPIATTTVAAAPAGGKPTVGVAAAAAPANTAAPAAAAASNNRQPESGRQAVGGAGGAGGGISAASVASSNSRQGIAVMPKPKQLVGSVPSDTPTYTYPGKPSSAPKGLTEPTKSVGPASAVGVTAAAAAEVDSSSSSTSSSTHEGARRRLQQQEGEDDDAALSAEDDSTAAVEDAGPDPAAMLEDEQQQPTPTAESIGSGSSGSNVGPQIAVAQPSIPLTLPSRPTMTTPIKPSSTQQQQQQQRLEPLGVSLAYTSFTVGDPRPPTASLALTTGSNWVKPDGSLSVSVTTKSYVGSDVSEADVTLKWSTGKADGELLLRTNGSGVATGTVELSTLPAANRSEAGGGSSLSLRASWVGPTREVLTQSKSVRIADGPVRVELQRTLLTDVPGIAFGVRAEAFSNQDDSPVKGATVEVTLSPANGSASLTSCTAAQKAALSQQKCTIKSGDPAAATACQLMLPCAGEFKLKGCIAATGSSSSGGSNGGGGGCSKETRLGRNLTTWEAAPWSSGAGQIQLLADRYNISLGQDVALTLQNPFWGPVSALVVWGNGVQTEQFYLEEVPPGASTVVIQELGDECKGGCTVVVTLAVARPQGKSANAVPRSAAPIPATAAAPAAPPAGAPTLGTAPPAAAPSANKASAAVPPQAAGTTAPRPVGSSSSNMLPPSSPSRGGGSGFRAPPTSPSSAPPLPAPAPASAPQPSSTNRASVNSPPRGLSGGGSSGSLYNQLMQSLPPEATGSSNSGNGRRQQGAGGLWPFNIHVYGLSAPRIFGGGRQNRQQNGGSSNNRASGFMRFGGTAARNERGLAAVAPTILSRRSSSSSAAQSPSSKQKQQQGGGGVAVAAVAVRALPDIPRSALYDPYAPVTISAEVQLSVPNTDSLNVSVAVSGQSTDGASRLAVLAPKSQQGAINVVVRDGATGAAVAGAEVTLVVVDKAVLDQMPYALQDVAGAMQPKLRASFNLLHLNSIRVTRAAINATFSTLQRRLTYIDPWLPVDTQVTPSEGWGPMDATAGTSWLPAAAAVDQTDDVYLRSFTTALTPLPARPCPPGDIYCPRPLIAHSHGLARGGMVAADAAEGVALPIAASMAAPAPAAAPRAMNAMAKTTAEGAGNSNTAGGARGGASSSPAGAEAQLRLQQDFKITPLFKVVKTGTDGKVSVSFPAPDSLGRYVVRAYVAAPKSGGAAAKAATSSSSSSAPSMVYGAAESQMIVRRTVSLVPSLPRQVRVGDAFSAGVLVEAPGTVTDVAVLVTATTVTTAASASSGSNSGSVSVLSLGRDGSKMVILTPSKPQQEVRFDFVAGRIGVQNITFSAAATGGVTAGGPGRGFRAPGGSTAAAGSGYNSRGLKQLLLSRRAAPPTIVSAGAVADQVQLQVPVNGKQGSVVVATSFAVRGSGSAAAAGGGGSWQEGMVLPRAEKGSGSINLVAGVGSLPAIQVAYTSLAEQGLESSRCTPSTHAVSLALLPAFLRLYQQPGAGVSSFLSTQQVALTQAAISTVTGKLTHPRYGLLAVEPSCLYPAAGGSAGPERADITLNAWATWLARQALTSSNTNNSNGNGSSSSGATLSAAWGSVQSAATKTWSKALEVQLVADAVAARQGSRYTLPGPYTDLETLSWARLVLGPGWEPNPSDVAAAAAGRGGGGNAGVGVNGGAAGAAGASKDVGAAVKKDLSLQRLTAAALAGNLTVGGQARVGLTLLKQQQQQKKKGGGGANTGTAAAAVATNKGGKPLSAAEAAKAISKRLLNNIRVGGRTAYIATGDGARAAAGLSDQALALAFLVESGVVDSNPLVQKLAAWVAQGAAPPPLLYAAVCVSSSPWDAGLRSQALTSYDSSTASLTPQLKLDVAAQPQPSLTSKRAPLTLLSAGFTPATAGKLASSSTSWDALPPGNSSLAFSAQGNGGVSLAAALDFTPAELLLFPTYRGFWVQQALLVEADAGGSSSSGGGVLRALEGGVGLGKIITVAVQVTSPDDQSDVLVDVMMPGGLEPLDPNVFKDPDAATICSSGADESPLTGSSSNNIGFVGGFAGGGGVQPKRGGFAMSEPMMMLPGDAAVGGGDGGFAPPRFVPPWRRSIWPICPLQTTAPDRVTFRYAYMRAGTHTMRFRAVAATSGSFVLPPVKASVQQQPEVMGLSPAGSLTVCSTAAPGGCAAAPAAASGGETAAAAAAPAKACPQDCNGNGACNLATGRCICSQSFAGVACADIATS